MLLAIPQVTNTNDSPVAWSISTSNRVFSKATQPSSPKEFANLQTSHHHGSTRRKISRGSGSETTRSNLGQNQRQRRMNDNCCLLPVLEWRSRNATYRSRWNPLTCSSSPSLECCRVMLQISSRRNPTKPDI